MRPKTLIFAILLLSTMLGTFVLMNGEELKIDRKSVKQSAFIDYPSEYNFRQTINDCGPYNTAAVTRALLKKNISSSEFAKNISWRLPNKYTLPWGLEKQLQENGVTIEIPNAKDLADNDKIIFLQERLSNGHPIIILGGRENYQHYISIFGFNSVNDRFYVYDSLFKRWGDGITADENGELPGNTSYSSEELLKFWRAGGMYGFYNWYAIVAGK